MNIAGPFPDAKHGNIYLQAMTTTQLRNSQNPIRLLVQIQPGNIGRQPPKQLVPAEIHPALTIKVEARITSITAQQQAAVEGTTHPIELISQ